MRWLITLALVMLAGLAACLFVPRDGAPAEIAASGDAGRGEYMLRLGGCVTCHTDERNKGAFLAGGRALSSPYGTFYTSNITPDPATGIGGWSTADFVRAMTEGKLVRVVSWYDNEWGFSNRMVDTACAIAKLI